MTQYAASARTNQLALIGFIAAFLIPPAGVILSVLARRQLDAPGNSESGRGLARWAMVVGVLGTFAQIGFLLIWFSLFFRAVG